MIYEYKTIQQPVEDIIIKEKGSKFIGFAYPINNETELKKTLEHIRESHPKATHHCYAFRLGLKGENYRANDDGEPTGSAGLPIYNQLLANDLTNIIVIIVRYYGGTKLGVSGLVKTYKDSTKMTLDEADIVTKELESTIIIEFEYNQQNSIFTLLNKYNTQILEFRSEEKCTIIASYKNIDQQKISDNLSEMHNIKFELL